MPGPGPVIAILGPMRVSLIAVLALTLLLIGCGHERIRADLLGYAKPYWPMELVEPFVRKGWWRWFRERPVWFNDTFRSRVPVGFIPSR